MRSKCRKDTSTKLASWKNNMQSNISHQMEVKDSVTKLKTSMHPPESTQEATMKWNLEFPVNSKQSSKSREAQIEKTYLLFQAVSITHRTVPCPFPQSLVNEKRNSGREHHKGALGTMDRTLRNRQQRNQSTRILEGYSERAISAVCPCAIVFHPPHLWRHVF